MRRIVAVVFLGACALAFAGPVSRAGEDSRRILRSQSFWRVRIWGSPWVTWLKSGKFETPPRELDAPEGWAAPGFDDEAWVRAPGPFFTCRHNAGWIGCSTNNSTGTALILARGRFSVTDPKAVGALKLSVSYRGGAVAYLNGKEIGRGDMPDGKIEPHTTAKPYPDEAFVVPGGSRAISAGFGDPKKYMDRIKKRWRSMSVEIKPELLRKGINVLALEFHRAPYNEVATYLGKRGRDKGKRKLKTGRGVRPYNDWWSTVAMLGVDLRATGGGVVSNVTRGKGFQVWNADPLLLTYDTDYGDAGAPPSPVRVVGARGGRHSGVLVTGCDKPVSGLNATVSDLVADKGGAKIPASAVEIRYQLPAHRVDKTAYSRLPGGCFFRIYTNVNAMDALAPEAPKTVKVRTKKLSGKQNVVFGAVCPVWLTVHVPMDAAAGKYSGECTITASGVKAVKVPVKLEVCDWTIPPAHKWRTAVGFHQSPESVAMHYKVPFWSDEHFKLLGESYRWLGSISCDTLFVHLVERTNLGNAESIVRWKRRKSAGPAPATDGEKLPKVTLETHEPDFTAVDRYLDTALKHLVDPPVICLYAWDNYCGTMYHGGAGSSHNVKPKPARVTELLPGGKTRSAEGPNYKNVAEAAAFWKPVGEHIRAYLQKRKLEKSLMIGLSHDSWAAKFVVDTWKKVLPASPWCFEGHPRPGHHYGVPVQWCCTVWGATWKVPRGKIGGWQLEKIQCHFDRDNWRLDAQSQLLSHGHLVGEKNISGGQRGFGRMSADLWPVIAHNPNGSIHVTKSRGKFSLSSRYPESGWGACDLRQNPFLKPGPKGALSTGRLEMIRDGLQECEARIFIESALFDAAARARLGSDLEKRCRSLLGLRRSLAHQANGVMGAILFLGSGRQERVRKLYQLAGEVAGKTGR